MRFASIFLAFVLTWQSVAAPPGLLHLPYSGRPPAFGLFTVDAGPDELITILSHTFKGSSAGTSASATFLWTQLSGPGAAVITDNTQTNSAVTFPSNGQYRFELAGTDGVRVANDVVIIEVQTGGTPRQPPTVTGFPNFVRNEDIGVGPISFTVGDDFTAPGSLTVLGISDNQSLLNNANVVIGGGGATRTITLTPTANGSGIANVTVSVTDDDGMSTNTTFQVQWLAVNDAPIVTGLPGSTVTLEDNPSSVQSFTISDVETPAGNLGVSAGITPTSLGSIAITNNNGVVSFQVTPSLNQFGSGTINIAVSDGSTNVLRTVPLTVTSQNDAPVMSAIADPNPFPAGQAFVVSYTAFDVEDIGNMTYTRATDNPAVVPLANIVLSTGTSTNRTATITGASAGVANVTLTATDSGGLPVQRIIAVTISPAANSPPTVTPPANQTVFKNQPTGSLSATVADAETPVAQLVLWAGASSNPALIPTNNVSVTGSTGTRTIVATPVSNVTGSVTITLRVRDGGGVENTGAFTITVTPTNYPPTISQPVNPSVPEDGTVQIQVSVADPDHATSALITTGTSGNTALVPNGNIVSSGTGTTRTFTVSPAANQSGTAVLTLQVSDGSATAQVNVTLTVSPVNDSPTLTALSDVTVALNNPSSQGTTVADIEQAAGALILSGTSGNTTLVPNGNITFSGTGSSRTVTVTPVTGQSGTAVIQIIVSDGVGGSSSDSFNFTVTTGGGRTFYVSPSGSSGNSGLSTSSPWNLGSVLTPSTKSLVSGDTVFLMPGVYSGLTTFSGTWTGIKMRGLNLPYNNSLNARFDRNLTCDGEASVRMNAVNFWLEDVVFENTAPRTFGCDRPEGLISRSTRAGLNLINCVVRNTGNGIGLQDPDESVTGNSLVYGLITYYNGFGRGSDYNHGHGIYCQNKGSGTMQMEDVISWSNLGQGHQFSGSDTILIGNYNVIGYMSFMNGPPGSASGTGGTREIYLGFANDMRNILCVSNYAYFVDGGSVGLALGHPGGSAEGAFNTNALVVGNWIYGRGGFWQKWNGMVMTNNIFANNNNVAMDFDSEPPNINNVEDRNFIYGLSSPYRYDDTDLTIAQWRTTSGYGANDVFTPGEPPDLVRVRANRFNPRLANVWIWNGNAMAATVNVNMSAIVASGDSYEIRYIGNVSQVHSQGIASNPAAIPFPMTGFTAEAGPIGPIPHQAQPTTRELGVFRFIKTS